MQLIFFVAMVSVAAANVQEAHLTKSQTAKIQMYGMECLMKTGVGLDVLARAKKGDFADDEALKKFTLCFFQKIGILTKDGKLNEEVALAKVPAELDKAAVKKVLEGCKNKSGKDIADTAFQIFICFYKATPTHVTF